MKHPTPYHFGRVERGRAIWPESYYNYLRTFDGQEIRCTIEKRPSRKSTRSQAQNAYYWAGVIPIAAEAMSEVDEFGGVDKDAAHEILARKFLSEVKTFNIGGKKFDVEITRSTKDLSKSEFIQYIEDISRWLFKFFGVTVPPADSFYESAV